MVSTFHYQTCYSNERNFIKTDNLILTCNLFIASYCLFFLLEITANNRLTRLFIFDILKFISEFLIIVVIREAELGNFDFDLPSTGGIDVSDLRTNTDPPFVVKRGGTYEARVSRGFFRSCERSFAFYVCETREEPSWKKQSCRIGEQRYRRESRLDSFSLVSFLLLFECNEESHANEGGEEEESETRICKYGTFCF